MNSSSKSFYAVVLAMLLLLAPAISNAAPIIKLFKDTTIASTLILHGTAITSSNTFSFDTGACWKFMFTVYEDTIYSKLLTISGSVTHLVGPHSGDAGFAPSQLFTLSVNADNVIDGSVSKSALGSVEHPGKSHRDKFDAKLTAIVSSINNISGYDFVINTHHVPESSTIFMLLLGIASIGISFKRFRFKV